MTYHFTIDIAKMKRWHGAPPLLAGQDEADFEDFIASIAACVQSGDPLAESLLYRYGLERWRMGQLLFQREKLCLVQHFLIAEFKRRDEERREHREDRKTGAEDRATLVKGVNTRDIVFTTVVGEDVIPNIRRNMHYRHDFKLDEMTAAREFEFMISQYAVLERSINHCEAQAKELLHQMAIHRVKIEERQEKETMQEYIAALDEIMDAQEKEREAHRAAQTTT